MKLVLQKAFRIALFAPLLLSGVGGRQCVNRQPIPKLTTPR